MAELFYHASHEQFSPSDLLAYVQLAEAEGFHGCHASDHFYPWSEQQGHSGYVFSWLGAALEATRFPFSVITAPGQRYHPAIVAQAIGTLLQMYPDRLAVSLGSGEALNECITGELWPDKPIRNKRLRECASLISRLLAGEEVSSAGLVRINRARLYTRPSSHTPLMCAALSEDTAAWAGTWADGLLTCYKPAGKLKEIVNAFRSAGGNSKPVHVKLTFSYARDENFAKEDAYTQWRFHCIDDARLAEIDSVQAFDRISEEISLEQMLKSLPVSDQAKYFIGLINEVFDCDVDRVILHNVNRNQTDFIRDFGNEVLKKFY
ncbi:MAG: TIGR03885 family FMN-dependent LLM class oxidoreductase [Gammaproteobacteria bacterium]|nr:MAG: TIGR03885 family FMN-dependent LLM class oxidoreductase [Gammaproteobacteria bacterium]